MRAPQETVGMKRVSVDDAGGVPIKDEGRD
jgi:hypothetical protein